MAARAKIKREKPPRMWMRLRYGQPWSRTSDGVQAWPMMGKEGDGHRDPEK